MCGTARRFFKATSSLRWGCSGCVTKVMVWDLENPICVTKVVVCAGGLGSPALCAGRKIKHLGCFWRDLSDA